MQPYNKVGLAHLVLNPTGGFLVQEEALVAPCFREGQALLGVGLPKRCGLPKEVLRREAPAGAGQVLSAGSRVVAVGPARLGLGLGQELLVSGLALAVDLRLPPRLPPIFRGTH